MSTIPEYEPREFHGDVDEETSIDYTEPDPMPEATTQEFRDITTHAFQQELLSLVELVGPGQLATLVTTCIADRNYLKEVLSQMKANLDE